MNPHLRVSKHVFNIVSKKNKREGPGISNTYTLHSVRNACKRVTPEYKEYICFGHTKCAPTRNQCNQPIIDNFAPFHDLINVTDSSTTTTLDTFPNHTFTHPLWFTPFDASYIPYIPK